MKNQNWKKMKIKLIWKHKFSYTNNYSQNKQFYNNKNRNRRLN